MSAFNRRRFLQVALGFGASRVASASTQEPRRRRSGLAFGTVVSVTLEGLGAADAENAFGAAFAEIRHVERIASLYRADSDIVRLNGAGELSDPDPGLVEMLRFCDVVHRTSAGAFDVTVQPLWQLCDERARQGRWPTDAEIRAARSLVDQSAVSVTAERIRFGKPGMAITLNGVAQGYAADRVAARLAGLGVRSAFLDTGEFEAVGLRSDGRSWAAAIRHPRDEQREIATLPIVGALATSGDYQYSWSPDFARNHILDPRSGASPSELASVSVLAPSGLLADALSTAVFVMGAEEGFAMAQRFGAEALVVSKQGQIRRTAGFPSVSSG